MQALAEHQIPAIDMVVVNLYAFEKVAAKTGASMHELIENIDIGGPTLDPRRCQELSGRGGGRIARRLCR